MQLSIKQMQQQLLLAYQTSHKTPYMGLEFRKDRQGEYCINIYLYDHKHTSKCKCIDIYEYMKMEEKIEQFKQALLYINGELIPFEEE